LDLLYGTKKQLDAEERESVRKILESIGVLEGGGR